MVVPMPTTFDADQIVFSAGVLIAALGLGVIAGVLGCAWRFWHGGAL